MTSVHNLWIVFSVNRGRKGSKESAYSQPGFDATVNHDLVQALSS